MALAPITKEELAERNPQDKGYESFLKSERKCEMMKRDFMFTLPDRPQVQHNENYKYFPK